MSFMGLFLLCWLILSDFVDDMMIDFDDDDEGLMKLCILCLLDGDNVAREVVVRTRRRDVVFWWWFKGEMFVVVCVYMKYEWEKCCVVWMY